MKRFSLTGSMITMRETLIGDQDPVTRGKKEMTQSDDSNGAWMCGKRNYFMVLIE